MPSAPNELSERRHPLDETARRSIAPSTRRWRHQRGTPSNTSTTARPHCATLLIDLLREGQTCLGGQTSSRQRHGFIDLARDVARSRGSRGEFDAVAARCDDALGSSSACIELDHVLTPHSRKGAGRVRFDPTARGIQRVSVREEEPTSARRPRVV